MAFYIAFLAIIYLLFAHWATNRRLNALQKRFDDLSAGTPAAASEKTVAADVPSEAVKETLEQPPEELAEAADHSSRFDVITPPEPVEPSGETPDAAPATPSAFVFKPELGQAAMAWARQHWFYLIAAASLAAAGVFLIQYGVERGLLSPPVRVGMALALGIALVAAAEWLRRKGGDETGDLFAYVPSTLASGGVITLFGAVWGAFGLYQLIGAELTFIVLALVGLATIGLGWFYGPLLSAIGIIGAVATPFLLGGDSDQTFFLNYYFAIIVIAGLGIDSFKRWAWLSALALILGVGAASFVEALNPSIVHYLVFSVLVAIASLAIPMRTLEPRHEGAQTAGALWHRLRGNRQIGLPDFPVRVAWGTFAALSILILIVPQDNQTGFWMALGVLGFLLFAALLWARRAPALTDIVLFPAAAFLALGLVESPLSWPALIEFELVRGFMPPDAISLQVSVYLGVAALASLAAAWRSFTDKEHPVFWSVVAASFLPAAAIVVDLGWAPAEHMGPTIWALYIAAIALFETLLMQRYVAVDGGDKQRVSYALVSAMTMLAFALITLLTATALTLALAIMVLAAIFLDRRYELPLMAWLAKLGVIIVTGRLIIYPGLVWAMETGLTELLLGYGGSIGLIAGALYLLRPENRDKTKAVLESALWTLSAIFACILLARWMDSLAAQQTFWQLGLFGTVWWIAAANQLYRIKIGGMLQRLRKVLFVLYGSFGTIFILLTFMVFNPLYESEPVVGPIIFNTLLVAYGLPALVLGFVAARFTHLTKRTRLIYAWLSAGFAAFYLGTAIRHAWRGSDITLPDMSDGELYSYTIAMMIIFSVILVLALMRKSRGLRQIAFVGLAITSAKVFLIDAAGLTGLIRVVSFLALGLALAGLAWLNQRFGDAPKNEDDPPEEREPEERDESKET